MAKIIVAPAQPNPNRPLPQAVPPGRMTKSMKGKRRQRGASRYGRMNTLVGRFLILLVILSAIPVASNRPAWWLIWTMVLGVVGLGYVLRSQMLMGSRRQLQTSAYRMFFTVALIVPLYAVLQALPWAQILPAGLIALPDRIPAAIFPHTISVMPDASLLGAIRAAGFLVFLMLTIEVGTQADRTHTFGLWLMIGILAHGIFGMVALKMLGDISPWGEKDVYLGMLTGTFVNRNSIATFLGFGLIIALAYAMARGHKAAMMEQDRGYATVLTPERMEILGLWLAVGILAAAIFLTQSRMGSFATGMAAFITFVTLRVTFKARIARIALEVVIFLGLLSVLLIPAAGTGLVERSLFALVESDDRVSIYLQTLGMIADRPWTGFGYDAFAPAFELYRAPPLVADRYADLAHNTYLALWSEQGLIVGSIPMILIGWSALIIIRKLRQGEGDVALNAAGIGAIVLAAVHSTVDFSLEIPANVFCFLLIVGLAIARPRLTEAAKIEVDAAPQASSDAGNDLGAPA